jgi:hypothetical protein
MHVTASKFCFRRLDGSLRTHPLERGTLRGAQQDHRAKLHATNRERVAARLFEPGLDLEVVDAGLPGAKLECLDVRA